MSYCPHCGAVLMPRRVVDGRADQWVCSNPACGRVQYRNAKPCAGALIERDGMVLLVRRNIEPYLNHWDIPGGYLEEWEYPTDGAVREALEETGLQVEPTRLLGIFLDSYGDTGLVTFNVYYRCRVLGGTLAPADDAAEARWFRADELPREIAFPGHIPLVLDAWRASFVAEPDPDPAADATLRAHLGDAQPE